MMNSVRNRNHRLRLLLFGVLLVLVMLLIFYMSSKNGTDSHEMSNVLSTSFFGRILTRILPMLTDNEITSLRKYAHIFEFFCLGMSSFLFFYELFWVRRHRLLRAALAASCWSFLYACTDEWHQTFVPERAGQVRDLGFDAAGFLPGVAVLCLAVWIFSRKKGGVSQ